MSSAAARSAVTIASTTDGPAAPAVQEVDGHLVFNIADPIVAAAWEACQGLMASDETDGGQ